MTGVRSRDNARIGNDESASKTNRDEVKKKKGHGIPQAA